MAQRYRLFVQTDIIPDTTIQCEQAQAHYLLNVLRLTSGAIVNIFNGRDGEWQGELQLQGKKSASICAKTKIREQQPLADLVYLFAPIKRARMEYMVQKATEMGASVLQPVITQYTNTQRLKLDKMQLNAVEAAEQCNLLAIPEIRKPQSLKDILENWQPDRTLIFCDEQAEQSSPITQLNNAESGPLAVLIGPEGGFSPDETTFLRAQSYVLPISLGPRIMRADTAAVAALALVQATLGDWRSE